MTCLQCCMIETEITMRRLPTFSNALLQVIGRMREGQRPSQSPSPPPALSAAQRSASRVIQEHELTSRDLNGVAFSGPISQVAAAEKKVR